MKRESDRNEKYANFKKNDAARKKKDMCFEGLVTPHKEAFSTVQSLGKY